MIYLVIKVGQTPSFNQFITQSGKNCIVKSKYVYEKPNE